MSSSSYSNTNDRCNSSLGLVCSSQTFALSYGCPSFPKSALRWRFSGTLRTNSLFASVSSLKLGIDKVIPCAIVVILYFSYFSYYRFFTVYFSNISSVTLHPMPSFPSSKDFPYRRSHKHLVQLSLFFRPSQGTAYIVYHVLPRLSRTFLKNF